MRNVSINPGRGGLFLEDCITPDGCAYVRRTGISSNVRADKGSRKNNVAFLREPLAQYEQLKAEQERLDVTVVEQALDLAVWNFG